LNRAGWLCSLDDGAALDRGRFGAKGACLGWLRERGHPVPDGFCLSVDAYELHASSAGLPGDLLDTLERGNDSAVTLAEFRRRILETAIDGGIVMALREAVDELGAESLAVRSSATTEDLEGASAAGLHDTLLNIRPRDLAEAVRRCWSSLWSERAHAYRKRRGIATRDASMAIVVQTLVPADVSGVTFTAHPVSGDAGTIVIEAAPGLGEGVVGGRLAPDRFIVRKADLVVSALEVAPKAFRVVPDPAGGTREEPVAESGGPCLDPDALRRLARVALDIEACSEGPMDIEWVLHRGEVFVLQSRPVTALRSPSRPACPAPSGQVWSNLNAGEVMPDVVSPLSWSVMDAIAALIRGVFRRAGIDVGAHPLAGRVAGRTYFNLNTFVGIIRRLPFSRKLTAEFRTSLGGLSGPHGEDPLAIPDEHVPAIRTGALRILLHLPSFIAWVYRHRPARGAAAVAELARRRRAWSTTDPARLSESQLARSVGRIIDQVLGDESILGFPLIGVVCFELFNGLCRGWFRGDPAASANALLVGRGGIASADAGLELYALAVCASSNPGTRAAVEGATDVAGLASRLTDSSHGREFLARWARFMREHGHHARGEIELMNARWSDTSDHVLGLVRCYLERLPGQNLLARHRARARRADERIEACRRRLGAFRRRIFDFLLAQTCQGNAIRENLKSESVRHIALARRFATMLGARLAARGALASSEDVFFLERSELVAAAAGEIPDLRRRVEERRREYAFHVTLDPPHVVFGDFDPDAPRRTAEVGTGETLLGLAVSPGVARGPARVILRASADEKVLPGEILVAPFTDPGWTPYFVPAAGIVMDMGGLVSHGSIVAREYGVPCVVNVGSATRRIATGQMVEVDGDQGVVRVVS
jgi:pyruvate,water dikinase